MCAVENRGVEKIFVHWIGPGRNVGLGEEGIGAGIAWVDGKRLLEQAPSFTNSLREHAR